MKFDKIISQILEESPDSTIDKEGNEYTWNGRYNYDRSSSDIESYEEDPFFEVSTDNVCFIILKNGEWRSGIGITHAMLRKYESISSSEELVSGRYFSDANVIAFWDSENVVLDSMDYIEEFIKDELKKSPSEIDWDIDDNLYDWDGVSEMLEDRKQRLAEDEKYEENNPYLKKTGRTKTIAGYKCEEYTYENEDVSSRFWITHDLSWNYKDLMRYTFTSSIYSYAGTDGFLMESETYDKKTGEKMLFQVTDISNNISKDIDLSGYNITNLGNMNMPSGEEQK